MIRQVLAYIGEVESGLNAYSCEFGAVTYTRVKEYMRRPNRSGGEDGFFQGLQDVLGR